MAYTLVDFPQLRVRLLSADGLWGMLRKDLRQIIAMPCHFDQATHPELGCGPNLSLMMVAMGGVEAMATLANIDGLPPGANAADMVQRFAARYFPQVNPLYGRPPGESLPMLIWDGYRNGGLHKYFPKQDEIATTAGQTTVVFGLTWPERVEATSKRSLTLDEMQAARAANPAIGGPGSRHLSAEIQPNGVVSFWVCAPFFALEMIDAVERWLAELVGNAALQQWFVDGADKLDNGLKLRNTAGSIPCLTSMVNAALAAAAAAATGS
jgi:hypothetical protein